MAKLKRDERLCPVCAETVKAAAIRCRFCQSELTPTTPAPEPEPVSLEEPVEVVESDPIPPSEPETPEAPEVTPAGMPAHQRLTAILAALVACAAIAVGLLWWHAERPSDVAPNETLVSDEARTQAIVAGADLSQRALSYDYRSLKNDMQVARVHMTPGFRKEYDSTMKQVRALTLKNQIVLQADAVASSILTATEHRATVLVFLNQTTTAAATKRQQFARTTLVVTLTRAKGDWYIAKLSALG